MRFWKCVFWKIYKGFWKKWFFKVLPSFIAISEHLDPGIKKKNSQKIFCQKYFFKKYFQKYSIPKCHTILESWDQMLKIALKKYKFWDFKKSLFSKSFVNFSENTFTKTFTSNSGHNLMAYRAVDHHNMMGERGFRQEQLKIQQWMMQGWDDNIM